MTSTRRFSPCSRTPRSPAAALALTLTALAFGFGCARDASVTRAPAGVVHTQANALGVNYEAFARLGYQLAWRGRAIMGKGGRVLFFDAVDGGVLVQSTVHTITMMENATGSNRWSTTLGAPLDRFVGQTDANGSILIASDNELFILDRRTGEITDKQNLALVVSTPPVVAGPIAVFGSGSGEVLGHNLQTGFKLWGYQLHGSIQAPPVAVGALVGVVSQRGDVIIIDPSTGSATLRGRIFDGLANHPIASDDTLFIASLDQSVYAFPDSGSSWRWRVRTEHPIAAQPALLGGVLYLDIPGQGLAAIDPATGARRWTNPDAHGDAVGARRGDVIVFSHEDHAAFRIDADTGDIIERADLPGVERMLMRPAGNGDLYTATAGGAIGRYVPQS